MLIMARRLTIITLSAAVFAITFSAAVQYSGGGGAQSHFGANFTCLQSAGNTCTVMH